MGTRKMLVELDEILHTLDERGRLPTAAVARILDLHGFDVRIALVGAATWGLVRRDGRGAWVLTERGLAAVRSGGPIAARPRPLRGAQRVPVLAAWALAAVAVIAVLAAGWVSRPAAPSIGSELRAASGPASRAFVGISRSGARRSHFGFVSRPGASAAHQNMSTGRLPAAQTRPSPRVATTVPRAIAGARPAAIVPARGTRRSRVGKSAPVPIMVRALRTGGRRLVAARRASPMRRSKHRAAVRHRSP